MPYNDRRHPARLDRHDYQAPDAIMFATIRGATGVNLSEPQVAEAIVAAMGRVARKRKTLVHAYCLMRNHLHVVVSLSDEGGDLERFLRYFKRETSTALKMPGMWQRSWWDRHARKEDDVPTMISYTLDNPVRAGLCCDWRDWPCSWSAWHEGGRGEDPNRP